jgi:hypothetical protein
VDLGKRPGHAAGFRRLGHRSSCQLPFSRTLQYNPKKI